MVLVKHATDINWTVSVKRQRAVESKPGLAIVAVGSKTDAKVYNTLAALANDFAENTNVYSQASAAFSAPGYNAPIEVITYSTSSPAPKSEDGKQTDSAIVQAVAPHIYDGFRALVGSMLSASDFEEVANFCYNAGRVACFYELNSADYTADATEADTFKAAHTGTSLDNTFLISNKNDKDNVIAAQVAAYMVANVRAAAERITNLTSYSEDTNLLDTTKVTFDAKNVAYVVNKAGDLLLSTGKTPAGSYIDQFMKTQYIVDFLTEAAQKWLNRYDFISYDDNHIKEFKGTLEAAGDLLFDLGILSKKITVTLPTFDSISNSDVANRTLNGAIVDISISNGIDTINGKINLTV